MEVSVDNRPQALTETRVPDAMHASWQSRMGEEFSASYMRSLREYLVNRKSQGAVIYPHSKHWFEAFALTPFEEVKVLILGQDPYHGPGQAHGLSFSVPPGVNVPPSLLNIYKEIDSDFGDESPGLAACRNGCLTSWATQGVFLLNSVLTVERGQAASHQGRGWEEFTDAVIRMLNEQRESLVFLLWGSYAQKKGRMIDTRRHHVLKAPHPSPLSAHRGFLGCRHFSQANQWLSDHQQTPIDWFSVAGES